MSDDLTSLVSALDMVERWKQRAEAAEAEVEQERVRLAGCSVVAHGSKDRPKQGDYGWSVAADDVAEVYDRMKAAEAEVAQLREALEPFADFAVHQAPADHVITQGSPMAQRQLTMGDCQRARQALNE